MQIKSQVLKADFEFFEIPPQFKAAESVAVPTVRSGPNSRLGSHAYYFLNFEHNRAVCVKVAHLDLIRPGFSKFAAANPNGCRWLPKASALFSKFHYGYNFLEQILLLTVPHSVSTIGNGKFIVCLWAYYGYLIVDCINKTVQYNLLECDENLVFGSTQWIDSKSETAYLMCYSMEDSLKKVKDPFHPVCSKILKLDYVRNRLEEVWSGHFSDYMHEILVSADGERILVCDVGRFLDMQGNLIPSKVLIVKKVQTDLQTESWIGTCVENGAHAQFDPEDRELVYFSHHNFLFVHTPLRDLLKKGTYSLDFRGPAAVYKFRLTASGPKEEGVFSDPGLFRLTNHHVFMHRGKKMLAAMGAPNFIYLVDAADFSLQTKLELRNADTSIPCYIGTFTPSLDGEKLYVQTTRSFQIVEVATGERLYCRNLAQNHLCSNHALTCGDISW